MSTRHLSVKLDTKLYEQLAAEAEKRAIGLSDLVRELLDPKATSQSSSPSASSSAPPSTHREELGPAGTIYEVQTYPGSDKKALVQRSDLIGAGDLLKAAKARNELLNSMLKVERQRSQELRNASLKKSGSPTGDYRCRVENCPVAAASFITYEALLAHQREIHPERFVR